MEKTTPKFKVPHNEEEIVFAFPSIGPDTYIAVGKRILEQRMNVPTGDYMASLLHIAYCDDSVRDELEFKDIRRIIHGPWLWVFNINLWTSEGVYVVQDLESIGRSQLLNQNDLEKMLKDSKELPNGVRFSKNRKVRFAPKESYRLKNHTHESLAKDGFVIASYGTEGAKKLGEVSSKFTGWPCVYGLKVDKPEQRVSALGGIWEFSALGSGWGRISLCIDSSEYKTIDSAHAFGILR